jgi:hypothetical protein
LVAVTTTLELWSVSRVFGFQASPTRGPPDFGQTLLDEFGHGRKENRHVQPQPWRRPGKAAEVMIAVASPHPPAILVLSTPTVCMFRAELDARRAELDAWEEVSSRTSADS